ncbi:hypothetical protein COCCADRAFT_104653 [Bipolaris zeicola 26-R-13]|uniref:Uncharacterized protein n=1 Tax=Cochliobolus carbonum (strain 26-R-13) TaxID=930089 RepID=W6Y4W0_COCC2|nr:uncharacterized protein COCCADRAFT_104653 [Bipolaris zeicola 26-R-13]EUC30134.1 hypothetical protein COCCADRAFT_104653 [Bipolaris zeicola 26-R-13]
MGLTYSRINFPEMPLNIQVDYSRSVYDTFFEVVVKVPHKYGLHLLPEPRHVGPMDEEAWKGDMRARADEILRATTKELLEVLLDLGISMGLNKVTAQSKLLYFSQEHKANRNRCYRVST